MIRDWWKDLSQRERRLIACGGIFLLIFILIYGIWLPLINDNKSLQQKISHQHALIQWMKPAVAALRQAKNTSSTPIDTTLPLINIIETSLADSPLSKAPRQVNALNDKKIQVEFERVVFDTLTLWLEQCGNMGVTIENLTIEKLTETGFVAVRIVLYVQ